MAWKRMFPVRDCFVTNHSELGFDASQSNTGASEILYLFKTMSGSVARGPSFSHILMDFGNIPRIAGAQYILHLSDAPHEETIPHGYSVWVYPNSSSFIEGNGHDLDTYRDLGVANWLSSSNNTAWSVPGAYVASGTSHVTASFDDGHEDMDVDVTTLIPSASNGFFIQLDPTLESDTNDYYVKMFFSRQTHLPNRRPYIEIRWNDVTGTLSYDREMFFVTSGSFSGVLLETKYSGSLTGVLTSSYKSIVDPTGALSIHIPDLKSSYDRSERPLLHVRPQPRDWNPAVVTTASSDVIGSVLTNLYYRVTDALTDEIVVPFGSGTTSNVAYTRLGYRFGTAETLGPIYTKLSYDDSGNYFSLDMSSFPTGSVLKIEFIYGISGTWTFVPGENFKFRIV